MAPHDSPLRRRTTEVCFPRLGGLCQQVVIGGSSPAAPLLLFLHGGPGATLSNAWFRQFNAPLEAQFTVVTWDQRGSGQTWGEPGSTLDGYVQDLHELIVWLHATFPSRGVLLVGHSWGSALGLQYVAAHPESVLGYVGIGQVVDMPRSEAQSYAWALQEAQRRGHRSALRALTRIGPPPYGARAVLTQRQWLSLLGGDLHASLKVPQLMREALRAPAFTAWDLWLHLRGSLRSSHALWPAFANVDLTGVQSLKVPVWFAHGRHDHVISPESLQTYVQRLRAPHVDLKWFEASGHAPQLEEPARFNRWLVDEVRPHVLQHPTPSRQPG